MSVQSQGGGGWTPYGPSFELADPGKVKVHVGPIGGGGRGQPQESPLARARAIARAEIALLPLVGIDDEARIGVQHPAPDCGWLKEYQDVPGGVALLDVERDVDEHLGECDRVTELIDRPLVY